MSLLKTIAVLSLFSEKTRKVKCTVCGGSGQLASRKLDEPFVKCNNCNGTGEVTITIELR